MKLLNRLCIACLTSFLFLTGVQGQASQEALLTQATEILKTYGLWEETQAEDAVTAAELQKMLPQLLALIEDAIDKTKDQFRMEVNRRMPSSWPEVTIADLQKIETLCQQFGNKADELQTRILTAELRQSSLANRVNALRYGGRGRVNLLKVELDDLELTNYDGTSLDYDYIITQPQAKGLKFSHWWNLQLESRPNPDFLVRGDWLLNKVFGGSGGISLRGVDVEAKLDFGNLSLGRKAVIFTPLTLDYRGYGSYEEASIFNIPADNSDRPLWYEWCVFNQERFTDFHSWMAEIVHELDPQTPVHAKVMANLFNSNTDFATGIDHVAMARLGEVSGNDCWTWYPGSGYAQDWQRQAMYYTFQRSVAPGQPVFNSENHIIRDDHDQYYPGNHIYTALWEGFMQGMGATTIWVWERNESRTLGNNILTRPNCVEAAAKVSLDINRLSEYVHKLQQASTEVAILYSHSAAAWPEYLSEVRRAFEAAYCQGVPLRFVTEDQILSGALASSKILLAPAVTHISEPVFQHIKEYVDQGGILFASGQTGAFDEYSKTRDLGYFWGGRLGQREQIAEPLTIECVATDIFTQQKPILEAQSALQRISPSTAHVLATVESSPVFVVNNWGGGKVYYLATSLATEDYFKLFDLLFEEAEVNRPLRLTTEKGEKVLGIDFKVIEDQEKYYANAVNFTKTDLTVRLQGRKIEKIRDLVTNEVLSQPFELGSLKPRLLEITLAAE